MTSKPGVWKKEDMCLTFKDALESNLTSFCSPSMGRSKMTPPRHFPFLTSFCSPSMGRSKMTPPRVVPSGRHFALLAWGEAKSRHHVLFLLDVILLS